MSDRPIKVNYEIVEQSVASMKQISSTIDTRLDELRRELNVLATTKWDGDARTAWKVHQDNWDAAVVELNTLLQEIAVAVGQARENYLDMERDVSRTWNNATPIGRGGGR